MRRFNWKEFGNFRGVTAAASLKLEQAILDGPLGNNFRGVTAAASLKQEPKVGGHGGAIAVFPRSNRRGLVKPGGNVRRETGERKFPRCNCRGLIEALRPRGACSHRCQISAA